MTARARFHGIRWQDWRSWPSSVARLWRISLQFRTVAITVALSGIAILLAGGFISFSIGNDLFTSRLNQVLGDGGRATTAAQRILDASDAADRADVQTLLGSAQNAIGNASSSRMIALYRSQGQPTSALAPQDVYSPGLQGVITEALRTQVAHGDNQQYWQSVTLRNNDGSDSPGIVVGSQLIVPAAGRYELYIGYNLTDSQQTLAFVQGTLVAAGLALMALIGAVTWVVVRFVVMPIRVAAETSQRLAAGDLAVRIPERGEDVIATLARSFNAMADSLQSQITQLATLSQVQQRFVSDVSHELRTPLTTIRLAGDVLYDQRDTFPPATGRTAELLHTQVQRFELLLSDLLEISRYDAGSATLEIEPTNLVRLVEDAIDGVSALAEQNGSEIRLVAPGGYFAAEMDPRRVRRIVRNLLGNAIEHGEGKPIVVSVDSNASAVAVSVRDYGMGMSSSEVSQVFDRFWRADPSRRRTIGGTGLGLSIAQDDTTLHKGWLQVWSSPGAGSSFRLTLPRAVGVQIVSSPIRLPPEDAPGAVSGDRDDHLVAGHLVAGKGSRHA